MSASLHNLPLSAQYEIRQLILAGNKIAAIKRYRKTTHCDLKTAKEDIEEITEHLRSTQPTAFHKNESKGGKNALVVAAVVALLVAGAVIFANIPMNFTGGWEESFKGMANDVRLKAKKSPVAAKVTEVMQQAGNAVKGQASGQKSAPAVDHQTPYAPEPPADPETGLTELYRKKLANPEYLAWKNLPGIPQGYQDFPEEDHIKYVRAEIARHLVLPEGTEMLTIPVADNVPVSIDGAIQHQEWLQATKIKLQPEESGSTLYLLADRNWLYLAADVPGDTTRGGFDQFRFYIHVDIDPAIKNERIHVNPTGLHPLGGIRETRIRWEGGPPQDENERWKKYPINDWRIYRLAMGASTMEQHRQFEAKLNLMESGLTTGKPFPVFVEVETDPLQEEKHRTRQYLGKLGNQNQPVWMVMSPEVVH